MTGITSPKGFLASGIRAGIKEKGLDLALISSPFLSHAAGVFTCNSIKAAPVVLSQTYLKDGYAQAIVINSGCANAATGKEGETYARRMCRKVAKELGISETDVLVASTGVIGERLSIEKVEKALPDLAMGLSPNGGKKASMAILTTDTRPKTAGVTIKIKGKKVTLGGMAKGSGMIAPRMATLLSFVTTDCNITSPLLKTALKEKTEDSFNQITIDGDMSTNDSLFIMANGRAQNPLISGKGKDYFLFAGALEELLTDLARQLVLDGEGATRLIEAQVINAGTLKEAREMSKGVTASNLIKAMVFGRDPNWGRILASIGMRGNINEKKVKIWIQGVNVFRSGKKVNFNPKFLSKKMGNKKVSFLIDLCKGKARAKAWGCDLTPEYVHINAHYRT
ncbi:MAG: bifunctional glutamate N-acetyltransferase/amino-acid acetyltransferase ArgJ [Candidatus Omnitrophica bacterium]|nr:bifunctional glutamate N-acetyltransferase/amino-acid acetyltransferase ArgJ [Candidatus Omnitrophota bacterium]